MKWIKRALTSNKDVSLSLDRVLIVTSILTGLCITVSVLCAVKEKSLLFLIGIPVVLLGWAITEVLIRGRE